MTTMTTTRIPTRVERIFDADTAVTDVTHYGASGARVARLSTLQRKQLCRRAMNHVQRATYKTAWTFTWSLNRLEAMLETMAASDAEAMHEWYVGQARLMVVKNALDQYVIHDHITGCYWADRFSNRDDAIYCAYTHMH